MTTTAAERWVPWSGAQIAAFRRMWAEGMPVREIATALGRTPGTVVMQRIRLGLPSRHKKRRSGVQQ